jgi:hypothetical protein
MWPYSVRFASVIAVVATLAVTGSAQLYLIDSHTKTVIQGVTDAAIIFNPSVVNCSVVVENSQITYFQLGASLTQCNVTLTNCVGNVFSSFMLLQDGASLSEVYFRIDSLHIQLYTAESASVALLNCEYSSIERTFFFIVNTTVTVDSCV